MPNQNPKAFFNQKRTAPEIKSLLLPDFFKGWLAAMLPEEMKADRLVLADVNAGLGFDAEGNALAPVKILQEIFGKHEALKEAWKTVETILLDSAKPTVAKLKTDLETLDFYEELSAQIQVSDQQNLPENFQQMISSGNPVLLASDPFQHDFTSQLLLQTLPLKPVDFWMLFTPAKLKAAFFPEKKETGPSRFIQHFSGEKWAEIERKYKGEMSAKKREQLLIEHFEKVLQDNGRYVFTFRINQPGKEAAAFYLVFSSFNKALYFKAKEQLQAYADFQEDGVALNGVNLNYMPATIPGFSAFLNKFSLENLTAYLAGSKSLFHFATIRDIYETHSLHTPYSLQNYLAAFEVLRQQQQVNLMDKQNRQLLKATPDAVVFYRLHQAQKAGNLKK